MQNPFEEFINSPDFGIVMFGDIFVGDVVETICAKGRIPKGAAGVVIKAEYDVYTVQFDVSQIENDKSERIVLVSSTYSKYEIIKVI